MNKYKYFKLHRVNITLIFTQNNLNLFENNYIHENMWRLAPRSLLRSWIVTPYLQQYTLTEIQAITLTMQRQETLESAALMCGKVDFDVCI